MPAVAPDRTFRIRTIEIAKEAGAGLGVVLVETTITGEIAVDSAPLESPLARGDVILLVNGYEASSAAETAEIIKEAQRLSLSVRVNARGSPVQRFGLDYATAWGSGRYELPLMITCFCCVGMLLPALLGVVNLHQQTTAFQTEVSHLKHERKTLMRHVDIAEARWKWDTRKANETRTKLESSLHRSSVRLDTALAQIRSIETTANETQTSLRSHNEGLRQSVHKNVALLDAALARISWMESENATLQHSHSHLLDEAATLRATVVAEKERVANLQRDVAEKDTTLHMVSDPASERTTFNSTSQHPFSLLPSWPYVGWVRTRVHRCEQKLTARGARRRNNWTRFVPRMCN